MFTGIITDIGSIVSINEGRFEIACHYEAASIDLGASIACDGCCLTVTSVTPVSDEECTFTVDVSPETLNVTTLSQWQAGQKINLERALKMGDEFGGHIVSGHVDGIASISGQQDEGNSIRFTLDCPDELKIYIAQKGSVTLGGVSLTVNEVQDSCFNVNIIPHTLSHTCWQYAHVGTSLNIEVDLLARYALRASQVMGAGSQDVVNGV